MLQIDSWSAGFQWFVGKDLIATTECDPVVVFLWNDCIQRKFEVPPALHSAVAIATVAASLGQNPCDGSIKADGRWDSFDCRWAVADSFPKLAVTVAMPSDNATT